MPHRGGAALGNTLREQMRGFLVGTVFFEWWRVILGKLWGSPELPGNCTHKLGLTYPDTIVPDFWRHCSSHWPRRQRWASMDECRCLLLQQRLPTCRLVLAGLGGPGRRSRSCYILALGWIQSFEVKEGGRKGDVVYQARQCSRTYFI